MYITYAVVRFSRRASFLLAKVGKATHREAYLTMKRNLCERVCVPVYVRVSLICDYQPNTIIIIEILLSDSFIASTTMSSG